MRPQHLQTIREACIKANPDCMAPEDIQKGTHLRHYEGWETIAVGPVDKHRGVHHENGYGPIETFKVIGRPIRLADVLFAFLENDLSMEQLTAITSVTKYQILHAIGKIVDMWPLDNDDLNNVTDDCAAFITSVLSV